MGAIAFDKLELAFSVKTTFVKENQNVIVGVIDMIYDLMSIKEQHVWLFKYLFEIVWIEFYIWYSEWPFWVQLSWLNIQFATISAYHH